jgi:hypothetical protein
LLASFWLRAFITPPEKLEHPRIEDRVSELYNTVKDVPRSQKVGDLLVTVASDRVVCYSHSPLTRLTECIHPYLESIVAIGREHVASAPDLGAFMRNARFCPAAYGACMGEKHNSNACAKVEASCLEYVYDTFWRGRPFQNK